MGSKVSRRLPFRRGANSGNRTDKKLTAEQIKKQFSANVQKQFKKQISNYSTNRLVVQGKADKYPYWISALDLHKDAGDINKHSATTFYTFKEDKTLIRAKPRIPMFLHNYMNQTIRLILRYYTVAPDVSKGQAAHKLPEYRVLKRSVRTLLLHMAVELSALSDGMEHNVEFRVFEQHARNRRSPHIRPMKVQRVVYDAHDNFALFGEEFLLTIHKSTNQENSQMAAEGFYYRSMDTGSQIIISYEYKQHGTANDMKSVNESFLEEYKKALLSRQGTERSKFSIILPSSANCTSTQELKQTHSLPVDKT